MLDRSSCLAKLLLQRRDRKTSDVVGYLLAAVAIPSLLSVVWMAQRSDPIDKPGITIDGQLVPQCQNGRSDDPLMLKLSETIHTTP